MTEQGETLTKSLGLAFVAGLLLAAGNVTLHGQMVAPGGSPTIESAVKARPAMWKVQGAHGALYLFGSVHVLKPNVHWETEKVADAFHRSGTVYFEIADIGVDAQKAMMPMIKQLGLDPEHPLSTKLSKEDVTRLDTMLKGMGAVGEAGFEPMQPWLVYLTLSLLPAVKAGYDPTSGVDVVLQKEANTQGKIVKGFETAEQQMHYLADFPQRQQVELLHEALDDLPTSVEKLNETVADWEQGDVEKIAVLEEGELKTKHPDLYQKLLVDRNEKISQTLAGLLKDPTTGTVFVTVGAAHLAGPDSILTMLKKQGFGATREE